MGMLNSVKNKIKRTLAARNVTKYARSLGVQVGEKVKFISVPDFGTEPWLISIGNDVLICSNVVFLTHDGSIHVVRKYVEDCPHLCKFGRIKIGDGTFVGKGSTIMPNVRIGSDVIIAADSIVTKDVPDGMVVGGCPAKIICTTAELARRWRENMADYIPLDGEKDLKVWTTHVADYYWAKKDQDNDN